jgi:hypothetical protein
MNFSAKPEAEAINPMQPQNGRTSPAKIAMGWVLEILSPLFRCVWYFHRKPVG